MAIGNSEKGAIMHSWSLAGETLQDNELTNIRAAMVCAEARPVRDTEHDSALKQMAAHRASA